MSINQINRLSGHEAGYQRAKVIVGFHFGFLSLFQIEVLGIFKTPKQCVSIETAWCTVIG